MDLETAKQEAEFVISFPMDKDMAGRIYRVKNDTLVKKLLFIGLIVPAIGAAWFFATNNPTPGIPIIYFGGLILFAGILGHFFLPAIHFHKRKKMGESGRLWVCVGKKTMDIYSSDEKRRESIPLDRIERMERSDATFRLYYAGDVIGFPTGSFKKGKAIDFNGYMKEILLRGLSEEEKAAADKVDIDF